MWCHPTRLERRDDNDHFGRADHRRVDTHLDVHVAAALDERGALLGVESFETTPKGYAQLLAWPESFSAPSSFSASRAPAPMGLGSLVHLHGQGIRVVEVDRPTANVGAATEVPTPKTPSRPPGPRRLPTCAQRSWRDLTNYGAGGCPHDA